jgi:competence protein ComEA
LHSQNPQSPERRPLLRRLDQAAVATLTLLALVSLGGYWLLHGGAAGRWIEIEHAPRQRASFQVDVNEAEWPELAQLPGVGETLARRIVESRAAAGRYADLDELRRVRGIGPKTLEQMKPYLRPLPGAGSTAGP